VKPSLCSHVVPKGASLLFQRREGSWPRQGQRTGGCRPCRARARNPTQQAIQLGLLPRLRVVHTSGHERGQIYVPFVNWALAALTLGAVIGFGTSSRLAGAYGLAVAIDMV
jgi:hypothetical protein